MLKNFAKLALITKSNIRTFVFTKTLFATTTTVLVENKDVSNPNENELHKSQDFKKARKSLFTTKSC
mgnify:CR=1 FL=1